MQAGVRIRKSSRVLVLVLAGGSALWSCDNSEARLSAEAVSSELAQAPGSEAGGDWLPTGVRITPVAPWGATLTDLDPGLADLPAYRADHPVSTVLSPDGSALLVLTSGYNRVTGPTGERNTAASNEYVFVYDVSHKVPVKQQVLPVPNTFTGIAYHPGGREFYVTGGVDDNVLVYALGKSGWSEAARIDLGHAAGNGLSIAPAAAGIAVNAAGTLAVVANYENDSISVIDLKARTKTHEVDLRPGRIDAARTGVPGGEYPSWVVIRGDHEAFVSSQRDHEVVVVELSGKPRVVARIPVGTQPGRMVLNRRGSLLFVVNNASDDVSVIDVERQGVLTTIDTAAPAGLVPGGHRLHGSNPNSIALAPDEQTLYVTNGGTNSIAVVGLSSLGRSPQAGDVSGVVGLIPTGWYPSSVTPSADGTELYVANSKSLAGPNPAGCRNTLSTAGADLVSCQSANEYVWQLEKGNLLSLPVPNRSELNRLTKQVALNNNFVAGPGQAYRHAVMSWLRQRIRHVIYVIKENRTYDQVLGDLPRGDGDPDLALFPESLSPNHHRLATQFVTLDHFFDSGETSGVGWNWSTAARTTDSTEKTQPPNYAGRGFAYDWEGTNRNLNVGLPTAAERRQAQPHTPDDPDLLPGAADVASHVVEADDTAGYLWDAALRKHLTVRNYGCFGDGVRYSLAATDPASIPLERHPAAVGSVQFFPAKAALQAVSDPYFRGYDQKYPDYWRIKEWEREFDQYVQGGNLPNLELVRISHDHFGSFSSAIDGVNTPATQMADNDYALGLLVEKVAQSPYGENTVVFVLEDDAQDGPDHVDSHRSIALIAGAQVRREAVVSRHYTTVNLVRTIEDLLGLEPMGITDGLAAPMVDVFDFGADAAWDYRAVVPDVLRSTTLPVPSGDDNPAPAGAVAGRPGVTRTAEYWEAAMAGQDFDREDHLDTARFNRALWSGMMGAERPYPERTH